MYNFKLIPLEERIVLDAAAVAAVAHPPAVIYVDAHATGSVHDGTSWAKAYTNLQDALSQAASTVGTPEVIKVADGTYTPGLNRTNTFVIPDQTTIIGGYGGTTILSGNIGTSSLTDNTYTVVTVGTGVTATLQNLSISGGYNDGNGLGGGLTALNSNALTLSNVNLSNDFASKLGGGVYASGLNTLQVLNSQFVNDSVTNLHALTTALFSSNLGGGIYTANNSNVLMDSNLFMNDSANGGGAIGGGGGSSAANAAPPDLTVNILRNTFKNNSGYFSGAYAGFNEGNVNIIGNSFIGNTAERAAPALSERGIANIKIQSNLFDHNSVSLNPYQSVVSLGAVVIEDSQTALVDSNIFSNNSINTIYAAEGGALAFQDVHNTANSSYKATNNLFINNSTQSSDTSPWAAVGGAAFDAFNSGSVSYEGNIFLNNTSQYGGAVYSALDQVSFSKNIFNGNQATFGGAIDSDFVSSVTYSQNLFTGNHATNSGGAIHTEGAASVLADRNIFIGNKADVSGGALADGGNPLLTDGPSQSLTLTSNIFSLNSSSDHSTLWFDGGESSINGNPIANTSTIILDLTQTNIHLTSDDIVIA